MIDISDYDKLDYDYTKYWEKREYENSAEKNILNKLFSNKRGNWFLDIGGSYGRLTSTYYEQFNNPIILDYSLKTLQRNKDVLLSKYPNTTLIAANAYKMPFKENVFDASLMVRVLHHIEKPQNYFKELKRIMKNNSSYTQEYANKKHIKAIIRALFKLDFDVFSHKPYQQPQLTSSEGSKKGYEHIFYNYHPKHIKKLLSSEGFKVKRKYGCSFLRSPLFKKILGYNIMISLEKILQITFSWSNISPSIFLDTILQKEEANEKKHDNLKDILICPSCKNELDFEKGTIAICKNCKEQYEQKEGIWDFRTN